ncbi:MAG: hypothetical protein EXS46_03070 [Candidatus Taylorbacteria bacterium]|nr:hypothetical protein [Candidatus Taylorbacteria bacterium]
MIKWNKVTWYSRLGALILFLIVVPILAFYVGTQYQETVHAVNFRVTYETPTATLDARVIMDLSSVVAVKDPVKYYILQYSAWGHPFSMTDHIYKIEVDLNADGYKDILTSNPSADNGQAGLIWEPFINNHDKNYYFPNSTSGGDNSTITLRPAAAGYAVMPGETTKSLISYRHDSASKGSLVWFNIVDDMIVEKHQAIEPQGKDKTLYDRLLSNLFFPDSSTTLKIENVLVSDVSK